MFSGFSSTTDSIDRTENFNSKLVHYTVTSSSLALVQLFVINIYAFHAYINLKKHVQRPSYKESNN